MIAAVDLGNSRVKILRSDGQFHAEELRQIDWDAVREFLQPARMLVLCSTNPAAESHVREQLHSWQLIDVRERIREGALPIEVVAHGVGADRILAAIGALRYVSPPCVVADAGTATTVTVLDSQRRLIGGYIVPGIALQFRALHERVPHLPLLEPAPQKSTFGATTADAIRAGVVLATAQLIEAARKSAEEQFGAEVTLVLTGGFAWLLMESDVWQRPPSQVVPHLVLDGALQLANGE